MKRRWITSVLEVTAASLGTILGVAAVVAIVLSATMSRTACVDRRADAHRYADGWHFDVGAWIAKVEVTGSETCEQETGTQFLLGHLPVIGDSLERWAGGPANAAFYR